MKKILLAVEYVGREGFEESDKKIVDYIRTYNDFNEIHVLCREFILNDTGEYIRAKGIDVHTTENNSVVNAPKDYDEIVAVDQWANANIAMFNTKNIEKMPETKEEETCDKSVEIEYDMKGRKIADIVIPHHNRNDHLKECLDRIPNSIFNIIVVSGKSFAENCNKGARLAETENIIFLNDDTEPTAEVLVSMCKNKADVVGAAQRIPNKENQVFYGISLFNKFGQHSPHLTKIRKDVDIPNGFCLRIKKKAWEKLEGFDEKFLNGGEDTDLGLRALEAGMSIDYITTPILHKHSQSKGRLDNHVKNQKRLEEKWPQDRILKALKGDGKSVLIATSHLDRLGGSETWTYTMAKEFERLGYAIDVFTFQKGTVSEKLNVIDYPKPIYDLILINHNTCLEYLKDIKGKKIFTSHGVFPELEQPIDGADKYVAISEEVQENLKDKGYEAEIIRNGIDCDRFKPKKKIRKKPKVVLSMCQGEEAQENVKKACEELGLEFQETSTRIWEVEDKINEADIVFTLGRGAYESMACGRAVIVYDSRPYSPFKTADGIVTRNNAKKLAQANFSGRTNKLRWTVEDIKKEIKKYKDTMGTDNRKIAVTSFNVKKQAKKYIEL